MPTYCSPIFAKSFQCTGGFRPEIRRFPATCGACAFNETLTGGRAPSFEVCRSDEGCRGELEKKLIDQRAMEALDKWLIMTRTDARIQYREKAFQ